MTSIISLSGSTASELGCKGTKVPEEVAVVLGSKSIPSGAGHNSKAGAKLGKTECVAARRAHFQEGRQSIDKSEPHTRVEGAKMGKIWCGVPTSQACLRSKLSSEKEAEEGKTPECSHIFTNRASFIASSLTRSSISCVTKSGTFINRFRFSKKVKLLPPSALSI